LIDLLALGRAGIGGTGSLAFAFFGPVTALLSYFGDIAAWQGRRRLFTPIGNILGRRD
jgi:hypothetical protein